VKAPDAVNANTKKENQHMNIAIASGKGGTGKTTISTNLAFALANVRQKVQYIDCDAEEPNGHIFLKPRFEGQEDITVAVAQIDNHKCVNCGKCGSLCQYNAIACLNDKVLVFEELCHSCGGCIAVCPAGAMTEKRRKVGLSQWGLSDNLRFAHGKLDVGSIQTPAIIKHIKKRAVSDGVNILDAPPGTSCPVIETIKDCDFVLLVTEPTPFGLNDFVLAAAMLRKLGIAFAAAINRCDIGDNQVVKYCRDNDIEVLMQIPNDRKIAESYSHGRMIVEDMPQYRGKFVKLYEDIREMVKAV
jgi:MinD superfamily P-loop ATPase